MDALMAEVEPDAEAIAQCIIGREQGSKHEEATGLGHSNDCKEPQTLDPNNPFDAIKLRLDALMAEVEADAEAIAQSIIGRDQGSK